MEQVPSAEMLTAEEPVYSGDPLQEQTTVDATKEGFSMEVLI